MVPNTDGIKKDQREAVERYRKAAEQGEKSVPCWVG